jgi:2-methylcitrate dehydratase PrpD
VIGHPGTLSAAAAAFINGTTAHGEDYDDTFEGGPVHAGSVIVPAVLAACEAEGRTGEDALRGIAVGVETICRLCLVVPKAVHKAGFHPTSVFGTMAAAAGVAAALRLGQRQTVDALGIAGSMAGGIIEYLAEGASTKRMHPGGGPVGLRAAPWAVGFSGRARFRGHTRTVQRLRAYHERRLESAGRWLRRDWQTPTLAFKPYPVGP